LPAANKARAVPAVTGACLMIARELYLEHNGLLSLYVQGGYEDSDLCLRLRRAGYENWYLPEVELYHLEGQSYEPAARERNARYNCWLHTELRGDAIAEAMAEFSRGTPEFIEPR
jgi:GT2 family glycosyltransferase